MTVVGRALPERRQVALDLLPAVHRTRPRAHANATLAAREEVTGTLGIFVVILDRPLASLLPGQYVSLGVEVSDELVQRPYSIVSYSAERLRVEFCVRRLPNGRFSNLLWALRPGDRVFAGPTKGLFILDPDDRRPRLMVGTGTGVAPFMAMLEAAHARGDRTPTVLIHGASFADEFPFGPRLESWIGDGLPLEYRPTVSRPLDDRNFGWQGRLGRADSQLGTLLEEWRWLRAGGSVAYLCGNPNMVEACAAILRDAQFSPADIKVELFHAPRSASTM